MRVGVPTWRTVVVVSTLILFDVDGTLLAGSGTTHVAAFADALGEVCGAPDPFVVDGEALWVGGTPVNGLVDAQIARLCLRSAVDESQVEGLLERFSVSLIGAYRALVEAGASCGSVLPGVLELLDELGRRGVAAGLVTGNTEEICALKMAAAGLDGRFAAGGFGGRTADRAALFEVAVKAARAAGVEVSSVCYVGDTPLDVDAARRAGVPIVAVATGRFSVAELDGADTVFDDLCDTAVADVLTATAAPPPRW